MIRILNVNLYKQDPNYAFCSLNAMRTICDYYMDTPPSRNKLLKMLKTKKKTGTYIEDILETIKALKIKNKRNTTLTLKSIKKSIDSKNLILISYQSGLKESHSSVICGYARIDKVDYVVLCDSWLGFYNVPIGILRVLFKKDEGLAQHFRRR